MPKIVDHELRRREITAVAAQLIAEGGLESATIREIAQHSGFSKGVVEHYFENKDELISAALEWANERYQQRMQEKTRGLSGLASIRASLQATLPVDKGIQAEWKVRLVFWSMAAIHAPLRRQQEVRFNKTLALYQGLIEQAMAQGEIEQGDANAYARHLSNSVMGIATAALHNKTLYTRAFLENEIDYLVEKLKTGF